MAMTLQERDYFRQKMLDEYGPGWEEIVMDYGRAVNPQVGPAGQMTEPGMSFDPKRFRTDNPLSLLSSREDIDAVLNKPTRQDYINELDRMDLNRLQGPVRPPMEMRTDGVPMESGGIIPYHAESFQNRISPLPHQLEGPETATGAMMTGGPPDMYGRQMAHRGLAYDPNQELYDPYYYGTPGQMGQMGAPPPGIIPSSVTGRYTSSNAPYSVTGRSAMSGGEMPGLLDSGGEQFSQAWPGPSSDFPNRNMNTVGDIKSFNAAYNQSPGATGASTTKQSGWMKDPKLAAALAGLFLQSGSNQSRDDDWDW